MRPEALKYCAIYGERSSLNCCFWLFKRLGSSSVPKDSACWLATFTALNFSRRFEIDVSIESDAACVLNPYLKPCEDRLLKIEDTSCGNASEPSRFLYFVAISSFNCKAIPLTVPSLMSAGIPLLDRKPSKSKSPASLAIVESNLCFRELTTKLTLS